MQTLFTQSVNSCNLMLLGTAFCLHTLWKFFTYNINIRFINFSSLFPTFSERTKKFLQKIWKKKIKERKKRTSVCVCMFVSIICLSHFWIRGAFLSFFIFWNAYHSWWNKDDMTERDKSSNSNSDYKYDVCYIWLVHFLSLLVLC